MVQPNCKLTGLPCDAKTAGFGEVPEHSEDGSKLAVAQLGRISLNSLGLEAVHLVLWGHQVAKLLGDPLSIWSILANTCAFIFSVTDFFEKIRML